MADADRPPLPPRRHFDVQEIKDLIALVAESGVDSLRIEQDGFALEIHARGPSVPAAAALAPAALAEALRTPAPVAPPAALAPAPAAPPEEALHVINSPIVGTFYRSASPEADPFAKIGDHVEKGKVLCIIEAMKLMNEIESDVDGEVVQVFPQNAQPVEFGERLFAIRPR